MILLLLSLFFSYATFAAEVFDLGTVDVVARRIEVGEINHSQVASVLTQEEMQNQNRTNVGDALNLLSGVTMSTNNRNEKIISVRGFDSRQVPLFIDGIPVYVPFDGYVDFNRFSTSDLSSIQVAKGFSSVAYGPNALGGAINLISKKPVKPLEADFSMGVASGDEHRASTNLGTNQGKWYLQTGASYIGAKSFPMSSDFKSTASEDGDLRNNSDRKDSKISVKVGLTPNASDEYALSFYQQNGIKGQPPSTDPTLARYWKWPFWNKQSLYFVSKTALGEKEFIKFRLYHDRFDNKINAYTNDDYTVLRTTGPGSVSTGKSIFHDRTNGGSVTLESYRVTHHTLTLVTHFKADEHQEEDATGVENTLFKDKLFSLGAEDSIALSPKTTLSLGVAHHIMRPDHVFSRGNPYTKPHEQTANEYQAGLFHDHSSTAHYYTTVAKKTRMPTLKDRYSQRLGTFVENPGLGAEQSLNLEVGYKGSFWERSKEEAAVFYNDITDKIQAVPNVVGVKSQVQNIDKVRIYGFEMGHQSLIASKFELGGNYTYTYVKNIHDDEVKVTDVPRHKLILNSGYYLSSDLKLVPFLEYNSRRFSTNAQELSGFTIVNLKLAYTITKGALLEAGVTNLADRNYSLAYGFPSPGRMAFLNANYEL